MKDLYRRNKLTPREADRVRIHNAEGSEEDKEAAFTILLNPGKKAEYDRVHATLSHIGYLRRHLGLAGKSGWRLHYSDFLDPPEPIRTRRRRKPPRAATRSRFRKGLVLFGGSLAVVAVLAPPLSYFATLESEPEPVAPADRFSQTMHALGRQVPVYVRADPQSAVLAHLEEFQDLEADPKHASGEWAYVRVNNEMAGYVRYQHLAPGSGEAAQVAKCRRYGTWRPESGQHLSAGKTGTHHLAVVNPPGEDALVKLKDHEGNTQVFFYVRGGETVTVDNVPQGRFQVHYALGETYSPACGRFLDGMQAVLEPRFVTFSGSGSGSVPTYTLKSGMYKLDAVDNRAF